VDKGYREQALKILPWICVRCAREFSGKRVRELTVHHRDGDHHNNPPDGSNWELLCIYCHENEHARFEDARAGGSVEPDKVPPAVHKPLADLAKLLKKSKK
jgi:hypothetical protein